MKGKMAKKKDEKVPKKKSGWLKQFFLSIMLLLVIGCALIMILPTFEKEDIVPSDLNSDIYSLLVAVGISDALVDVTPERVAVVYELPADLDEETANYYAIGAVAGAAPDSEKIVLQPHAKGVPGETVTVAMDDINGFIGGSITDEEFGSRLVTGQAIAAVTPAEIKGPLQSAAFTLAVAAVLASAGIGHIFRERLAIGAKIEDLLGSLRRGREERAKRKRE